MGMNIQPRTQQEEEKIQENTGKLMGEYYRKVKDEYLQFASKEGCEQ